MPHELHPLKVVFPRKNIDFVPDKKQKRPSPPFVAVTDKLRQEIAGAISGVAAHFAIAFKDTPAIPAVAKVTLRPKATAKSHRPTELFNEVTCPIIGVEAPGELLIRVDKNGLESLENIVETNQRPEVILSISTIAAINAYRRDDVTEGTSLAELKRVAKGGTPLRLRAFRLPYSQDNQNIDSEIDDILATHHATGQSLDYGDGVRVLEVSDPNGSAVEPLIDFRGVQNLTVFPSYSLVRTAGRVIGKLDDKHFPAPDSRKSYGTVGIIDSGTDPNNKRLQAWVRARVAVPAAMDQNNSHGSFVAGMIANARALNHNDTRFPLAQSFIVDVVALDKNGKIDEPALVRTIDLAVRRFPEVRVWNLSLGNETQCVDHRFSMLGMKLDSISKKRGVLFVVAAGNYDDGPLMRWPDRKKKRGNDRICAPADSVRSLTVASLAHKANSDSYAPVDGPSPFTRRGPGPHYSIKPEVGHYGGNCNESGDCRQSGVQSLDGAGNLVESAGTSYANAPVASLAAGLFHELDSEKEQASPSLVKAMLCHSAFVNSAPLDANDIPYCGAGKPSDLPEILNCTQSAATIIMHVPMMPGERFRKEEFPIPPCLRVPKVGIQAEIFMTLAYSPMTDGRYGVEYCRSNVNAGLGTFKKVVIDGKRRKRFVRQVPLVPKGITRGLEQRLVREGFKWSPLKFYYRKLTRWPSRKKWQLRLDLLMRSEAVLREPQDVVLLITIRALGRMAYVYQGLVREMDRLRWGATDLRIRSRARSRP